MQTTGISTQQLGGYFVAFLCDEVVNYNNSFVQENLLFMEVVD